MNIKSHLPLQRLIGKIDNDFNISESDWIPRVAAWTIDALSQIKCLPMERKRRSLEVSDRIAQFPNTLNATELKVYTKNGCEIEERSNQNSCCSEQPNELGSSEIAIFDSSNKTGVNYMEIATITNNVNKNYILDGNNIELNFDTDCIIVESYEAITYYDEYYECDCPYIYDNGLLLEALAWYVLYKYLSRGSKHQVYTLTSTNPVINPYMQWSALKTKAMISVSNQIAKDKGWNNFFYNSTFLPRS